MTYPYFNPAGNIPYNIAPRHEIIRVNGRNGAEAFQMAPNSQVLLLDETAPIVWLKTTDGAGYPTLLAYEITPAQTPEQKEAGKYDALEKRIANLEAMINEKSNSRSSKSRQTDGADRPD